MEVLNLFRPHVEWEPHCAECSWAPPYPMLVFLDVPLKVGNQCPRCLSVIDTAPVAEKIRDYWKAQCTTASPND